MGHQGQPERIQRKNNRYARQTAKGHHDSGHQQAQNLQESPVMIYRWLVMVWKPHIGSSTCSWQQSSPRKQEHRDQHHYSEDTIVRWSHLLDSIALPGQCHGWSQWLSSIQRGHSGGISCRHPPVPPLRVTYEIKGTMKCRCRDHQLAVGY
jgi:hypothetical protein